MAGGVNVIRTPLTLFAIGLFASCAPEQTALDQQGVNSVATTAATYHRLRWGYYAQSERRGESIMADVPGYASKDQVVDWAGQALTRRCEEDGITDAKECAEIGKVSFGVEICSDPNDGQSCGTLAAASVLGWQSLFNIREEAHLDQVRHLEQRSVAATWLQATLDKHRHWQGIAREVIEIQAGQEVARRNAIVSNVREELTARAEAVRGAEVARLAETRVSAEAVLRSTAAYEQLMLSFRQSYSRLIDQYIAYRNTEQDFAGELADIATDANESTSISLQTLKIRLADASNEANIAPHLVISAANELAWSMARAQATYESQLVEHRAYLEQQDLSILDHTATPRQALSNVGAYCRERIARSNAAVSELYGALRRREQGLILAEASEATRTAALAADRTALETEFLESINARALDLWRSPPASSLGVPLLAARHASMISFRQLGSLCEETAGASWRSPGCMRLRNELTKVDRYLQQTLPFSLRYAVQKFKTANLDSALIEQLEASLSAGDMSSAVYANDLLIRVAEEG
jgi:hypothetical protein